MALRSVVEEREPTYVWTGHLPGPKTVRSLVSEARRRFQTGWNHLAILAWRCPDRECPMPEMDRRGALRVLLGGVIPTARPTRRIPVHRRRREPLVASAAISSTPSTAAASEALAFGVPVASPLALEMNKGGRHDDVRS